MLLPHGFEKTLTEKTDEQLYDMLAHEVDYMPEALEAARMEIQRRNLGPTLVAQLESGTQSNLAQELQAAQRPLSWFVKLMLVLFGFTLFQILVASLVAQAYRSKGYLRKYKECWTWTWYGLGFWVVWGAFFGVIAKALDYFEVQESPVTEFLFGNIIVYAVICAALSSSVIVLIVRFRRRRVAAP